MKYEIEIEDPIILGPVSAISLVKGDKGDPGPGLRRNVWEVGDNAEEGQTEFPVDYDVTDNYIAFIDDAKQSHRLVGHTGNAYTYTPGLQINQTLEILG